jgi:hypothetical protein
MAAAMNRIPVNVGSRDGRVTARPSAVLDKSTIDTFATRNQINCEMGLLAVRFSRHWTGRKLITQPIQGAAHVLAPPRRLLNG